MSVAEDLVAARALIDTPEKWLRYRPFTDDRHKFCALGACWFIEKPAGLGALGSALTAALPKSFRPSVVFDKLEVAQFNDDPETTHADILALFDRAIAAARAPHLSKGAAE